MKISPHDPAVLIAKLTRAPFLARVNPFALSSDARTVSRWRRPDTTVRHWTQIPLVTERINERITGRPNLNFRDLVCRDYLSDGKSRNALSLGCGDGSRERDWAIRGVFDHLLGVDLNPALIATARRLTNDSGLSGRLQFKVSDARSLSSNGQKYDAIIFEHSLHHFANVSRVLATVNQLLRSGGLLILDEYIGPRRFQWTARQLQFADAILSCIPDSYRRTSSRRRVKRRHFRAGEYLMWLNDPSEAIESDKIEAEVARQFRILYQADYGGTISHLLFHDIAHNFSADDFESRRWARLVLDTEDSLLRLGLLRSDFACYVATASNY